MKRKLAFLNGLAVKARNRAAYAAAMGALAIGQAHAALDQTAFDAEMTSSKTDIAYVGSAFLILSVIVAVWLYLKRAAK